MAVQIGMSEADAQKRVNDVVAEAKTAADNARKGAAKLSFWLTAAMLFGAFAASLAAVEAARCATALGTMELSPPGRCKEQIMGRGILLWLLGVPIPIIILLALFSH